ncbi:MAG: hypothetical protein ACM3N0_01895 [Chloroflexota bacterium]
MNERQALEAARQAGVAPGDYITLQSEGQINNPHLHGGGIGPEHVDAWEVRNQGGELHARKFHNPPRP